MKKNYAIILITMFLTVFGAKAQMFTATPAPLQESSQNVVITFHADQSGVAGLTNLPQSTKIYAHAGVYTTSSPSTWSHVVTTWGKAEEAYEFKYVSANTYQLEIGDLRTFFKMTNPDEHITTICIIARTANGGIQTSDQFISVAAEGFQMELLSDCANNVIVNPTTVNFTVNTTQSALISLTINGTTIANTTGTKLTASYNISSPGDYIVQASAEYNGTKYTKSVTYKYLVEASQQNYPGGVPKMGAVRNSDGSVTFCLGAPGKSNVQIIGSWNEYQVDDNSVMKYQDYNGYRYFWTTINGLDNSTPYMYYFKVDGSINVGDPYAHLILDPYNDKYLRRAVFPERPAYPTGKVPSNTMVSVYQGNIDDYNWSVNNFNIPDHSTLNIYEMLFRDFTGTSSRDDGTVALAIEKIPYLKSLGINAVELMPIMEFNGNNSWGYNTNFYFAPDKAYGSPNDYKRFIDECHKAGIAVILDIVFNQSDGLHPWYQMYPIDSNPFYNKYAPHDFSVLNDWKQENPLVQQQWADAIRYWMTAYKVDGFRFDLVKGLGTSYSGSTGSYNASRVKVMKDLHSVIMSVNPKGIHINENLAEAKEENEMGADGQLNWANCNNNSCQYAMGYPTSSILNIFYAPNYGRTVGTTVSYAESHDEERMGYKQTKWGASGVKDNISVSMLRLSSVAAQMLMTPGAKMIWQFGELGADETTKDDNGGNNTSPKKVIWNYLDDPDHANLHRCYTELLCLRKDNPDLFMKDATVSFTGFSNSLSSARIISVSKGDREIITVINPSITSTMECSANTKYTASGYKLLSTSISGTPSVNASGNNLKVTLPANSYAVYGKGSIVGVESILTDGADDYNVVYVDGSRVMVAGDYNNAVVYSLSGLQYSVNTPLPAGVYIAVVDGRATKILVK